MIPAGLVPDPDDEAERALLIALRQRAPELRALLDDCSDHWGFEDPDYRFYHQSFKVYALQQKTEAIIALLSSLAPGRPLNPFFREIVREGTGRKFRHEHNANWTQVTRPIVEAFFHTRFFLEMAVRYAGHETPPRPLPSGYGALAVPVRVAVASVRRPRPPGALPSLPPIAA